MNDRMGAGVATLDDRGTLPAARIRPEAHDHPETLVREIHRIAQQMRIDVLKMVYGAQSGHIGGPFSAAEILASLYFHHLRIDPARPDAPERDRFLLSKGHASPVLYSALARRGFFPVDDLAGFRHLGTKLHGHPEPILPGVEIVAGPLGHGVSIGAGLALGARMGQSKPSAFSAPSARATAFRVYVLLGDGETNAGMIWEGAMTAAKYHLGNLVAILDYNGIQQTGATADVMPMEPVADKWRSFGWHVQEVHGHNVREILDALDRADDVHAQPSMIIARTTKGRGVSTFEYDNRWHGGLPNAEQYAAALAELEEGLARWS
jgi:transketolase